MRHHFVRTTILVVAFVASVVGGYVVASRLGDDLVRRVVQERLTKLLERQMERWSSVEAAGSISAPKYGFFRACRSGSPK